MFYDKDRSDFFWWAQETCKAENIEGTYIRVFDPELGDYRYFDARYHHTTKNCRPGGDVFWNIRRDSDNRLVAKIKALHAILGYQNEPAIVDINHPHSLIDRWLKLKGYKED